MLNAQMFWMWGVSKPFTSDARASSKLQPRLEEIWCGLISSTTKPFAEMQAWVLNSCETFDTLEVNPASSRHPNAYDRRATNWAGPPKGGVLAACLVASNSPTATHGDRQSRPQSASVSFPIIPPICHPSPLLSSTRLPLGVERT